MTRLELPNGPLVSRAFGFVAFATLAAFAFLALRRAPPDTLARLGEARLPLLAAGFGAYGAAFFLRGARLNLLLPAGERLPLVRAGALSAAALFLGQVIPFRGGELATWAAYRATLGASWLRSGAVFALAKLVDGAVLVLLGLAGAAVLALRGRATGLGATASVAFTAAAAALLLAPRLAGRGAALLADRSPKGSRRQRFASEIETALRVAHEEPRRYVGAVAAAVACAAVQIEALWLMLRALHVAASPAAVGVALLVSTLASATIPSPVGNFGPSESGFTTGLLLVGVPLPLGLVAAGILHLLSTASAGLVGLPFLLSGRGAKEPRT